MILQQRLCITRHDRIICESIGAILNELTFPKRIWDSQEFDHLQLPLQIILNDLSQHLAKVAGRIAGVAAGE